jgi:uncharacterized protein with GYD domain
MIKPSHPQVEGASAPRVSASPPVSSRRPKWPDRLRKLAIPATAAGLLALAALVPIRFPSGVNTYATIAPTNRWVLVKSTDGQLISSTFNYGSGMSEGYRVSTFNQGSSVYFTLDSSLAPGHVVSVGDTIASVYSTDVAEQLSALNGQLAAARGALAVNSSGQKSAIVTEAEKRLEFAKRRRQEHRKVERRTVLLFEQNYVPQGEYDRVVSEANALDDEIALAEANLEVALTGAKPEMLDLGNANIAALQGEIEAVKRRASTLVLTAPISGTITPTYSGDTLVTVTSTEFLALIPVRRADYSRVASTTQARLTLRGLSGTVQGTLIGLNREFKVIGGHEALIATGRLDGLTADLMPGMLVQCRIHCAPVSFLDFVNQLRRTAAASQPFMGGM